MKIHLRDNYFNTPVNREKYFRSPHVMHFLINDLISVCGIGVDEGFNTDDITEVECIGCRRIDERNFERGRDV